MFIGSCDGTQPLRRIETESLFQLRLGILESQLNVFAFGNIAPPFQPHLVMRNGIFAISDPASNKVMEFTSFGDLINLHFNPQTNPIPLTLRLRSDVSSGNTVVNKIAHPFEFIQIGRIAYTRQNMLLIQDQVPDIRRVFDEQRNIYLNQVILRFNQQGLYQDYIGQEGIGGTAFPPISNIIVTSRNHIVVTSNIPEADILFWYDELGDLLYSVEFQAQHLPRFEHEGYVPILDAIIPHMTDPYLFLKIDYHPQGRQTTEERNIISKVFTFELASGAFIDSFVLPENIQQRRTLHPNESDQVQFLYDLIGKDDNGMVFFISRISELQQQLLIMDTQGRVRYRGVIELQDGELVKRSLRVNEQGVVVGLLVYDEGAEIVWWRTDRLFSRR
jgi:hypothetical protein